VYYSNLTTKRRPLDSPSPATITGSQLHQEADENQKPKFIIEPGPHTDGYTIALRYDERNSIVITHIKQVQNGDNRAEITANDSDISQSKVELILNEV